MEGKLQISKRFINNETKEKIKYILQEMAWDDIICSKQTDSALEAFLKIHFSFQVFEKSVVMVELKQMKI